MAKFLRDDSELGLDFCSNVTGVDWLDRTVKKTIKVKTIVEGVEKEVVQTTEEKMPGYWKRFITFTQWRINSPRRIRPAADTGR